MDKIDQMTEEMINFLFQDSDVNKLFNDHKICVATRELVWNDIRAVFVKATILRINFDNNCDMSHDEYGDSHTGIQNDLYSIVEGVFYHEDHGFLDAMTEKFDKLITTHVAPWPWSRNGEHV